jgi:hypothetical protein
VVAPRVTRVARACLQRYHWAETVWLQSWLQAGNATAKQQLLTRLLSQGRLEILGGGWIQNDEAVTSFDAVRKITHSPQTALMQQRRLLSAIVSCGGWWLHVPGCGPNDGRPSVAS